jgi:methylated-DNA-protein-cysteine methyltransferase-like protein
MSPTPVTPDSSSAPAREAIYLALMSVPAGKVISYGELASLAGLPGAARLVGTVLSRLPENTELPWHRVINAQGRISFPPDSPAHQQQRRRLVAEGVEMMNEKINLRIYGYNN